MTLCIAIGVPTISDALHHCITKDYPRMRPQPQKRTQPSPIMGPASRERAISRNRGDATLRSGNGLVRLGKSSKQPLARPRGLLQALERLARSPKPTPTPVGSTSILTSGEKVVKLINSRRGTLVQMFGKKMVKEMKANLFYARDVLRKHEALQQHMKDMDDIVSNLQTDCKLSMSKSKSAGTSNENDIQDLCTSLSKLPISSSLPTVSALCEERPPPANDPRWNEDYWTQTDNTDWIPTIALGFKDETNPQSMKTVTDEKSSFAPLTERAKQLIRHVFNAIDGGAVILHPQVNAEELYTLRPNNHLDDEVVDSYLELLSESYERLQARFGAPKLRIRCTSSRFYRSLVSIDYTGAEKYNYSRVRRKTRKFDVFALHRLIVPVNLQDTHWTLAVVNFTDKCIENYDIGAGGASICEYLLRWLGDECRNKKQTELAHLWHVKHMMSECTEQKNMNDSGVFVCQFARFIASCTPLPWHIENTHINYFRARMAHEILVERVV